MISVFPRKNNINGVINVSSNLKFAFNSSSDKGCNHCPFYRNCGEPISWGAQEKNDWLEVSFGNDLLYITHYCINGKGTGNYSITKFQQRPKGWNVDAKDKSGVSHRIDTVTEGLLPENENEVHKIKNHGPFRSFTFTITDTYGSGGGWYSHLYGIDFFGVLNPDPLLMKKIFHQTCKRKAHNSLILYIITSLIYSS